MAGKPQLVTTTEIKIEKGVPIPSRSPHPPKVPFADLQVGDSLLVPTGLYANPSGNAQYHAMRLGRKFTARKEPGGVRIWRIA